MQGIIRKAGIHVIAILVFLGITVVYFAPAVFEGKTI